MAKDAFMKIFWGLLFIFLDIRINGIDFILPDFVGYILVVIGLVDLSSLHSRFRTAKGYATVMILLSFVDLVREWETGPLGRILAIIGTILNLVMVWHICQAIIELAEASANRDLAQAASLRWKLYLAVAIVALGIGVLARAERDLARLFVIPAVIFAIVAMFLMMGLMLRASREIHEEPLL